MNRFRATVAADSRVQYRNGFYLAAALVAAGSILLLRWLPADAATLLLPVVILSNVLVNTFYFVGGLLLLERVEGTRLPASSCCPASVPI
jgi:fluoroquinolone transport system permease protein